MTLLFEQEIKCSAIYIFISYCFLFLTQNQSMYDSLWNTGHVEVVSAKTSVEYILEAVREKGYAWVAEAAFTGARIRAIESETKRHHYFVARTSMSSSQWCIALHKGSPFLDIFNTK